MPGSLVSIALRRARWLFCVLAIAGDLELRAAQFTLTWADNSSNETGFRVERATGSSGSFAQIATTGANVTRYLDPNLAASTLYRYRVRAYNSAGNSGYSNIASGTTPAAGANTSPTISNIANRTVQAGVSSGSIAFTVSDRQTAAGSLAVSGSSSNQTLVPDAGLSFGGSGGNRTLAFTPRSGTSGTATITVRVSDGSLSATDTFVVTVTAGSGSGSNTAPTISSIADRSIPANGSTGTISFTIGDSQTSASQLTLTRTSSNTALIPVNNIVLGGTGTSRTVKVTPLTNTTGTATITIQVSDGKLTTSRSFDVTVAMGLVFSNIGSPAIAGGQTIRGSTIELRGAGREIGGKSDQFRLGRQYITGDAEMTVRLVSLTNTHASAAAGLMFRRDLSAGAAFVFVHVTPSNRVVLQYRAVNGGTAVMKRSIAGTRPRWLRLTRTGNTYRAFHSSDGKVWTLIDTVSVTLGTTARIGVAVCSHNASSVATGVFDSLALGRAYTTSSSTTAAAASDTASTASTGGSTASTALSGSTSGGAPSGSSASSAGVPTISSIATQFIAVNASSPTLPFTIADSDTATSRLTVTARSSNTALVPDSSIILQGSGAARTVQVRPLTNTSGAATITLAVSDGTHTQSTTFDVIISMALTFSDLGKPSVAGSQSINGDTITVRAAGSAIDGKSDQFRFGRQYIDGDCEMTVRVSSFSNTASAAMAGLMFRGSLSGSAPHVFLCVTPADGIVLQYRTASGVLSRVKRVVGGRAPRWLKLTRVNDTLYAYHSPDGESWELIDTVTVNLPNTGRIGLAVCSGSASRLATAVFDELTLD